VKTAIWETKEYVHEARECVPELDSLLVGQCLEAALGGCEGSVGGCRALLLGRAGVEERPQGRLDLLGPDHVEVVERTSGVPEDVWIGRRRDGHTVETVEGLDDVLRLVAEVEDEGALLQRVDAVQAGERLHRRQPDQRFVHVHRVEQRLVEAGLEFLGDDQDAVIGTAELLGGTWLPGFSTNLDRDGMSPRSVNEHPQVPHAIVRARDDLGPLNPAAETTGDLIFDRSRWIQGPASRAEPRIDHHVPRLCIAASPAAFRRIQH
jgi:hypothetical protein